MSDEPAETFSADAVRWIDGLSDPSGLCGSWRLQVLEHRVALKETLTGEGADAAVSYERTMKPVRLTRFAKGCPWALVPDAERYLLSLAPYTGKIVNGIDIPGTYKPTRTRWIRDDQTNLDDPRRSTNENRHTLVQDLVEASAADGDSVPQSADCVETVVAEYHWDEPSLPEAGDLPAASQGVAVSVQQVSRQEDGTYRYAIVTRTAKTRVGAEATVECTAFQSVVQQDFTNLYGDPGTGFEDEAGNEVEVPRQTCGAGGVNVEWRNLRQNDDCTWNVSVVTTAGTAVSDVERTSSETTVERRDTRKDAAQAGPLQHVKVQDPAVATAEGHVWEQRSELRPDGLYDNTVTKRDEKQLAGQVVEKRRTIRGTTVRTVNRNMPSAAADPSGIGAVVNTVTDSGRVTQEITEVDRNAQPVDAGSACSTTVFEHVESDRTIQPTKPAKHWQDAGGGHRYERTSRITEEGSYEVTAEDRQELQRTGAKVTLRKTLRGTQRTVVDRNVASPLAETGLAVGETRDSEVTPGGLYVNTTTVTVSTPAGTVGHDEENTIYQSRTTLRTNVAVDPGEDVRVAGGGRTYGRRSVRTEQDTWDVDESEGREKPVAGAVVRKTRTLRGVVVQRTDRNVGDTASEPEEIGDVVEVERTPGGLVNITKTTGGHDPFGRSETGCTRDAFSHKHSETRNESTLQNVETAFLTGRVVHKSGARLADGTANNTVVTTDAVPSKHEYRYTRDDGAVVHVIKYRHQNGIPMHPDGAAGLMVNDDLNEFGLHQGAVAYLTNAPVRRSSADFMFKKQGRICSIYQVRDRRLTRKKEHREWKVQLHHIRGDAYTDFVNDEMNADIARTTNGVLAVRLIDKYSDSHGNLLAEWKYVYLQTPGTRWTPCSSDNCVCGGADSTISLGDAVRMLLEGGDARAADYTGVGDLAEALQTQTAINSIHGSRRPDVFE